MKYYVQSFFWFENTGIFISLLKIYPLFQKNINISYRHTTQNNKYTLHKIENYSKSTSL